MKFSQVAPLHELKKEELVELINQAVRENERLLRACRLQRDRARKAERKFREAVRDWRKEEHRLMTYGNLVVRIQKLEEWKASLDVPLAELNAMIGEGKDCQAERIKTLEDRLAYLEDDAGTRLSEAEGVGK